MDHIVAAEGRYASCVDVATKTAFAAQRPYSPAYAPYDWRFWWDFGTGETGNWGCHILDIPFWALGLKYPTRVDGSGPPAHPQTTPKSMTTRFEFPARGKQPPITLHWYHTKKGPPILREKGLPQFGNNLFIGTKGMLLCDFGKRKLFPESEFEGFEPPPKSIPKSPGFHREWIRACKGDGEPPTCRFESSGPMASFKVKFSDPKASISLEERRSVQNLLLAYSRRSR